MPQNAIAFLLGIIVLQFLPSLPPLYWILALTGLAIFFYPQTHHHRTLKLFFFFALIGFLWVFIYAHQIMSFTLDHQLEDKPLSIEGTVASLPNIGIHNTSFFFKLQKLNQQAVNTLIKLSWPHPKTKIKVGDQWQLHVRLKRIHSTQNPGSFDYEAWAIQKGLRAQGMVLTKLPSHLLASSSFSFPLQRMRQGIQEQLQTVLPQSKTAPWLMALMIGERNGIPPSEWEVLRKTGTNHLMAIAGLHIGFLAAFAASMSAWLWRRSQRLPLLLPAREVGALSALAIALLYSTLAGFSLPTQRALIMISVYLLTTLTRRIIPSWQAWGLALMVVLIFNPLSLLSSSFWLSFMTIALLIYGMEGRLSPSGFWWKWGRPQWVIGIGLLPLSIWIFTQYSLLSFIANSIAIPWVGFILLPLCLLALCFLPISATLAHFILFIADKLLALLWVFLSFISQLRYSTWEQSIPHYGYVISAFVGVLILLSPKHFPGRYLGLAWLLPLCFYQAPAVLPNEYKFTLLDVGQGLSAVVRTAHHALVFDCGLRLGTGLDMGESVVLPYLAQEGVHHLDLLIISHGDIDHRGGAEAILKHVPVAAIQSSEPELFQRYGASTCLRGMSWDWDGVHFEYLNPTPDHLGLDNNSSCVLKVSNAKAALLIPGDLEKEGERWILERDREKLSAALIVAPHHGSKTSGDLAFLAAVHPQQVFYATGYHNRYHFPHAPVVESYRRLGAKAWDTASAGAIEVEVGSSWLVLPSAYRVSAGRWWWD